MDNKRTTNLITFKHVAVHNAIEGIQALQHKSLEKKSKNKSTCAHARIIYESFVIISVKYH